MVSKRGFTGAPLAAARPSRVMHKIALLAVLSAVVVLPAHVSARADYAGLERVATTTKVVALTFDADMTPYMRRELDTGTVSSWYDSRIVATLDREHVPSTIFLTGLWIETYPTTTAQLAHDPLLELGNHSYSHGGFAQPCYHLPVTPHTQDVSEVVRTDTLLSRYAPGYQHVFRFPGLCADATSSQIVASLGYRAIAGDVHGGDGFQKNTDRIVSTVVSHVRPGSIVVFHLQGGPDAPETWRALPRIIAKLRAKGYSFETVSALLGHGSSTLP